MVLVAVMSAAGATAQRAPAPASAMTVAGVELVDTLGQKVDLRGVVTGATPSVISFTYLGCRSICPTSDLVMDQVARLLEESP
ncbi:MAG: hypothetical protein AB7F78_12270, partial [Hyphomicrobiaceae bacterium]